MMRRTGWIGLAIAWALLWTTFTVTRACAQIPPANSCLVAGGGGPSGPPLYAGDKIGASDVIFPVGPKGIYNAPSYGFTFGTQSGWLGLGDGPGETIYPITARTVAEGTVLTALSTPGFCGGLNSVLSGWGVPQRFVFCAGPNTGLKEIMKPDSCSLTDGGQSYSAAYVWGLASGSAWAPILYGAATGDSTHPGSNSVTGTTTQGQLQTGFAGYGTGHPGTNRNGNQEGWVYASESFDPDINISQYEYANLLRTGGSGMTSVLVHGPNFNTWWQRFMSSSPGPAMQICRVTGLTQLVTTLFSTGGFRGDPNWANLRTTFIADNLQSYYVIDGCAARLDMSWIGAPVYSIGACPQVIGHIMAVNSASNIAYFESWHNVTFPAQKQAHGWPSGAALHPAGSLTCKGDGNTNPGLPPISEQWIPQPGSGLSSFLLTEYQKAENFDNSKCTDSTNSNCGPNDWKTVISNADPNIINGPEWSDNDNTNGDSNGGGDVYFRVVWQCTPVNQNGQNSPTTCEKANADAILSKVLATTNGPSGPTVAQALQGWGLQVPTSSYMQNVNNAVNADNFYIAVHTVEQTYGAIWSANAESEENDTYSQSDALGTGQGELTPIGGLAPTDNSEWYLKVLTNTTNPVAPDNWISSADGGGGVGMSSFGALGSLSIAPPNGDGGDVGDAPTE